MIGGLKIPNPMPMSDLTIAKVKLPDEVMLPIYDAEPLVKVGGKVLIGEVLANGKVWTHASISGEIIKIRKEHIPHPSNLKTNCITIKSDDKNEWVKITKPTDFMLESPENLIKKLTTSGIVGLGGAGFPTHQKLQNIKDCQTIIINACECEPAIEADNALMIEYSREIMRGVDILLKITSAKEVIIAIEDDKQEAFENLLMFNSNDKVQIKQVDTIYGSGNEKSLINSLLGIEVASGKFASDYNILMQNVSTVKAIYDFIVEGKPLIERVITDNRKNPVNKIIRIGEVVKGSNLRFGGLMMGQNLFDENYPILKTINAIFKQDNTPQEIKECIRCGDCVPVCPAGLLPQQLYWFTKSENIEKCLNYNLMDCVECRCCDEVCGSNIPLSQYFGFAKRQHIKNTKEEKLAKIASERFEFREYRLERNKKEREEMMAKKRAEVKIKMAKIASEKLAKEELDKQMAENNEPS
jgi:electron transport complex protein RnfC